MATYVIGDVQGCFRTLERLLQKAGFDAARDRAWLVGDLVNRGPRSLETLRWARDHDDRLTVVLGNHDLHLLARAAGVSPPRSRDTLDEILAAPDRDELLGWLRTRPLLHREAGHVMLHAGLLPSWTLDQAERRAREAEEALRGPDRGLALIAAVAQVKGSHDRLRADVSAPVEAAVLLTRLRMVDLRGRPKLAFKLTPEEAPPGMVPWFASEHRRSLDQLVLFGHWAALGIRFLPSAVALDAGCVWGRELAALRLDDRSVITEPYAD